MTDKNLTYKPSFPIDRHYDSIAKIEPALPVKKTTKVQKTQKQKIEGLNKKIARIEKMSTMLPEDIKELVLNTIKITKLYIDKIDPKDKYIKPSSIEVVWTETEFDWPILNELPDDKYAFEGFPAAPTTIFPKIPYTVNVSVPNVLTEDILNTQVNADIIGIIDNFMSNMSETMVNLYRDIKNTLTNSDTSLLTIMRPFTGTGDGISEELRYLLDTVIRSNIIKEQQSRVIKKLYSPRETMSILAKHKIVSGLRNRYVLQECPDINGLQDYSILETFINSKNEYIARYDAVLYDTYRHFEGFSETFKDYSNNTTKEIKAKGGLISEEALVLNDKGQYVTPKEFESEELAQEKQNKEQQFAQKAREKSLAANEIAYVANEEANYQSYKEASEAIIAEKSKYAPLVSTAGAPQKGTGNLGPTPVGQVTPLSQGDDRWGSEECSWGGTLADSGCGITCVAMIVNFFTGAGYTPKDIIDKQDDDLFPYPAENWATIPGGATIYRLEEKYDWNNIDIINWWKECIAAGGLGIAAKSGGYGTEGHEPNGAITGSSSPNHYVVVEKIDGDQIQLVNPNGGYRHYDTVSNFISNQLSDYGNAQSFAFWPPGK